MADLNLDMSLPPPTFFEELNQGTKEHQVKTLTVAYPELSQDEVVAYVEFYNNLGIPIGKDALENLKAGNPTLSEPAGATAEMKEIKESQKNPWFNTDPLATFFLMFLEMQAMLSKIRTNEAMVLAGMINTTLDMAKDLASTIKEIYQNEAKKAIISGVCNLVGGTVTAFAGGVGLAGMGGKLGAAKAQSYAAMGQGFGQGVNAIDKFATAAFEFRRATLEYSRTIIENALKVLQDRGMAASATEQQRMDELISKIMQMLDKISDEKARAHGFQVH